MHIHIHADLISGIFVLGGDDVFSHDHHNLLAGLRLSWLSLLQPSRAACAERLSLSLLQDDDETPHRDNDI